MEINTKFELGDTVYYLDGMKLKKGEITSITIDIDGDIVYSTRERSFLKWDEELFTRGEMENNIKILMEDIQNL